MENRKNLEKYGNRRYRKGEERQMQEEFTRTALLIGQEAVEKLEASRVAVFGVGGVGGYVAEALGSWI